MGQPSAPPRPSRTSRPLRLHAEPSVAGAPDVQRGLRGVQADGRRVHAAPRDERRLVHARGGRRGGHKPVPARLRRQDCVNRRLRTLLRARGLANSSRAAREAQGPHPLVTPLCAAAAPGVRITSRRWVGAPSTSAAAAALPCPCGDGEHREAWASRRGQRRLRGEPRGARSGRHASVAIAQARAPFRLASSPAAAR